MKDVLHFIIFIILFQVAPFLTASDWSNKGFFIENKGQIVDQHRKANEEVLFILQQPSLKIYLTDKGFSYEIFKCTDCPERSSQKFSECELQNEAFQFESYRVDINFLNSNKEFTVEKSGELNSEDIYYNHMVPGKEPIISKRYTKVIYRNIYQGVDIHFSMNDKGEFKYDLLLQDGADLSRIAYSFDGSVVKPGKKGGIIISTPLGDINETIPLSFITEKSSTRKEIEVHYKINGENTVSFTSSANLDGKQLLIDPFPDVQWATFYGDANNDMINSVTSDMEGNVIITGQTLSSNNIATTGSHQSTHAGDFDGFVTKFNKDGVRQWSTYYGGIAYDRGNAVCTDGSGNIYMAGSTFSQTNIATAGAWQGAPEGLDDIFLVKFNASGIRQWGTYYGGDQHDYVADIVADNNGDVLLTGHTRSGYNISTAGTEQPALNGLENVVLSKFSSSGNLLWGTYLGAGEYDAAYGIAIDTGNNVYIGGNTQSTSNIATTGTFQSSFQGFVDGFIVKFNSSGIRIWGTYFGGASLDRIWDIALDSNNNILAGGETESTDTIATPGAFQTSKGSFDESFLQKFDNNGQRIWGTFIGGNSSDYLYGVECIKSTGDIVIGGYTESDNNISTPAVFQPQRSGAYDAFVMKFNNNGDRYWGTYFGGPDTEEMKTLTLGDNNNIIIAGYTGSSEEIATTGAHQTIHGGAVFDGFTAKLCEPLKPVISSDNDSVCVGNSLILDAGDGFSSFLWNDGTTLQQHTSVSTDTGTYSYWVSTIDTNNCPNTSDTVLITVLPAIATPTITHNDSVLTSSFNESYQWYLDGNLVSGATGQDITISGSGAYTVIVTDTNGCYAESEPYLIIGVNKSNLSQKIKLYPNPADQQLYVIFDIENTGKNVSYTIFNALGQPLYNTSFFINDPQHIIPVDNLPPGVFYLRVSGDVGPFNSTFIVQH